MGPGSGTSSRSSVKMWGSGTSLPGGGGALTFGKGIGYVAPKSETIPLRTEVAYEPRGLRTKRPSPNEGLGNWDLT